MIEVNPIQPVQIWSIQLKTVGGECLNNEAALNGQTTPAMHRAQGNAKISARRRPMNVHHKTKFRLCRPTA